MIFWWKWKRALLAGVVLLGTGGFCMVAPVAAAPLYDAFMENFQVGTWSQPADIKLVEGYMQGLLTPAVRDSVWLEAARHVLEDCHRADPKTLTGRIWRQWPTESRASSWLEDAAAALADLAAARAGDADVHFLGAERLELAFDGAVAGRDYTSAVMRAQQIMREAGANTLTSSERFVWGLRLRAVRALAGGDRGGSDEKLWPELAALGPFDIQNGWAVWVAQRRDAKLPVLPRTGDQVALGDILGRLRRSWLTSAEIYQSALPVAYQSGLGAVLLPAADLPAHFKRFPQPPRGYKLQGWWVRGQRRLHHGQPGSYEQLAARKGLSPGWRLDVWRRASELRILRGAWVEGLADLSEALRLGADGHGTVGQRLRLRQWVAQALVLCLGRDDLGTARRLARLGRAHFHGDGLVAFEAEIAPWRRQLGGGYDGNGDPPSDAVRIVVRAGAAAPLLGAGTNQAEVALRSASVQTPWLLWAQWGRHLADRKYLDRSTSVAATGYTNDLEKILSAGDRSTREELSLAAVVRRLAGRGWAAQLFWAAFDADVGRLCAWQTSPRRSLVPALLPDVRGSQLDLHALLGFCQMVGDLRGIVGLATEIPAKGLTKPEKRRFLYPLPTTGPILEAVAAAESEPALVLAIARNESLFDPAVRSRAGALGWMQIMPFHYPARGALPGGGNWRLPAVSVARGDMLLVENQRRFHGDPYRAVAAYNAGPTAVDRWDRQLGGKASRDIFLAWIGYPETRSYVEKVLIDREIYRAIIGALSGHRTK